MENCVYRMLFNLNKLNKILASDAWADISLNELKGA